MFTSTRARGRVGDAVSVKGTRAAVPTRRRDCDNLTTTELDPSAGVTVSSSGNPLPPTIVIGARSPPPTEVIDDDAAGQRRNELASSTRPSTASTSGRPGGHARAANDAGRAGRRNGFGEIPVLATTALRRIRTDARRHRDPARRLQPRADPPRRRDRRHPAVKTGDASRLRPSGVLDYSFGNFKLLVTSTARRPAGESR